MHDDYTTQEIRIEWRMIFLYALGLLAFSIAYALVLVWVPGAEDSQTFAAYGQLVYYAILAFVMVRACAGPLKRMLNRHRQRKGYTLGMVLGGFFLMLGVSTIVGIIMREFGVTDPSGNQESLEEMARSAWYNFLAVGLFGVLFAPVIEELVFRKGVYGLIERRTNATAAILLSAFLFGGIHMLSGFSHALELLPYVSMGVVFGIIYKMTERRLDIVIGMHMLWNLFVVGVMLFGI